MNRLRTALIAISAISVFYGVHVRAVDTGHYRLVENWVQFPPEVAKWGSATGVDVDSHDNVYVFQRHPEMPVIAFDRHGKFLRAWGKDMFMTTHFLRVDRGGNVWVTDRGAMVAYKFSSDGKLLMTIGQKGMKGDNESKEFYNGMADLAVAKNGDIFIADGEGPNTRVVKLSKDGKFIKWWGGKGTAPGQFDQPHSIAVDSKDRVYVADRSNNRIQIFDKDMKVVDEWRHFGRPSGLWILKDDTLVVSDSESNQRIGGAEDAPEGGGNAIRNPGWKNGIRIGSAKDGSIRYFIEGTRPEGMAADELGSVFGGLTGGCDQSASGGCLQKFVKKAAGTRPTGGSK